MENPRRLSRVVGCLLAVAGAVACAGNKAPVATYGPPPRVSEPTPSRIEELQLILGDELTAEEEADLRAIRLAQYDPPTELRPPELDESLEQLLEDEGAVLVEESVDYDIPIVLNDRVEWWINYFTHRIRGSFERYLIRSGAWLPYLKTELAQAGLPRDLAYIVLIESGFSTRARSRANAVGPWQFIRSTGREYGLRIDRWVDERRDYERATQAAIAYLSDLHAMFGSWHLAAAGYNGGQGRLKRTMLRDHAVNFWELTSLRNETMNYVPKLLAATIVAKQPRRHGFYSVPYLEPAEWAKVTVPTSVSMDVIAAAADVPTDVIVGLNPHLLRGRTPPGESNFPVKIPIDRVETFLKNIDGAMASGGSGSTTVHSVSLAEADSSELRVHRVRRGDTLYGIARRYGVTVAAIKRRLAWFFACPPRRLFPWSKRNDGSSSESSRWTPNGCRLRGLGAACSQRRFLRNSTCHPGITPPWTVMQCARARYAREVRYRSFSICRPAHTPANHYRPAVWRGS
jgi:membrane-bound lytic murein transglycosylase D